MLNSLSNWQWLVQIPGHNRAALVSADGGRVPVSLVDGFERIDILDTSEVLRGMLAKDLDCIAIPDAEHVYGRLDRSSGIRFSVYLREALRSRSGIYVGIERLRNPLKRNSSLTSPLPILSRQIRYLRAAGFSDLRSWYLVTSPEVPVHIVPEDSAALLAWDRTTNWDGIKQVIRRLTIRVGLHPLIFSHRLVTARP